jgi:tRNA_anti-like
MERRIRYGIILFFCLIATLGVYGVFFQSRLSSPVLTKVDFSMTAGELAAAFDHDEALSDSLYLYKVLAVTGRIEKVREDETGSYSITLGASPTGEAVVDCRLDSQFNQQYGNLHPGDSLRLLGICAGRLQNVILVQSIIEK